MKQLAKRLIPKKIRMLRFGAQRLFKRGVRNLAASGRIIRNFRNFPLIMASWFGIGGNKKKLTAVLWNGVRYEIGRREISASGDFAKIVREVWGDQTYYLSEFGPGSPKVIIDIGAHVGIFSIFAARKFTGTVVYSFEPDPRNFKLLVKNIHLNGLESRIFPFQLAVSSQGGVRNFFRSRYRPTSNSIFEKNLSEKGEYEEVRVESRTLEEIFRNENLDRCDILKMDCEGAEFEILLSAPFSVLRRVGRITMEYHDGVAGHNHQDLSRFLRAHGFMVRVRPPRDDLKFSWGSLVATNDPTVPA